MDGLLIWRLIISNHFIWENDLGFFCKKSSFQDFCRQKITNRSAYLVWNLHYPWLVTAYFIVFRETRLEGRATQSLKREIWNLSHSFSFEWLQKPLTYTCHTKLIELCFLVKAKHPSILISYQRAQNRLFFNLS